MSFLTESGLRRLEELRRSHSQGDDPTPHAPAIQPAPSKAESTGHGGSRSRQTRRRLERALVESAQLDAERARSVTTRLERAREQLALAKETPLEDAMRAELEAAIYAAEGFASEVATLAARRDRLCEEAQGALQELANLERRALMAQARAEALERAQELEDEEAALAAPLTEEEIARRLALEDELRDRLDDLARLSEKLTETERAATENREQKARIEERLADERRKRIELQLELEKLEDRHEKFLRERLALDESARTIRERYTVRTERLYRALVRNEGALGEEVTKATRELMDASEELIRLQNDKASLLVQVERMRVALRRAKGLPEGARVDEEDKVAAAQERLALSVVQLKDQIDRRLEDLVATFESKIVGLHARGSEPDPAASSVLQATRAAQFFTDEGLATTATAAIAAEPPATEAGDPRAGISGVYHEAVLEIVAPLAPFASLAPEQPPVAPPEEVRIAPAEPAALERLVEPVRPESQEAQALTTRHKLQQALESGPGDEGELESLFQKQRRRLRGQETTPHATPDPRATVQIVAGDPDATLASAELAQDDRTPLSVAPDALEAAAASGLSDAIQRAKDALRARLEREGRPVASDSGEFEGAPALLDDDDDDDDSERVQAFVRDLDEASGKRKATVVPATPEDATIRYSERDTSGLVLLDERPPTEGHVPEKPALEKPVAEKPEPARDGSRGPLRPATFVKLPGRSPGAASDPTASDPASTSAFSRPPAASAGSFAEARALLRGTRTPPKATKARPRATAATGPKIFDRLRTAKAAQIVGAVALALALVASGAALRKHRHPTPQIAGPVALEHADTGELDAHVLEAWRFSLRAYGEALKRGEGEPATGTLAAFAASYSESEQSSPLREAFDRAAGASGFTPKVFAAVTRRVALADQRVTEARQLAVERHWKEKEIRESALQACGPNAASRRDVDAYLAHEGEVQAALGELANVSRDARALRLLKQGESR
jgi:hypothetical protein